MESINPFRDVYGLELREAWRKIEKLEDEQNKLVESSNVRINNLLEENKALREKLKKIKVVLQDE